MELTARVVFGVQLLQAGAGDVGVDLCGGEVAVAQQRLHYAQRITSATATPIWD
jgi:hypothetical protein